MYNFKEIEPKWQKRWEDAKAFIAKDDYSLPKFYALVEFPYPSGAGMHVGHVKAYSGLEVITRKRRMEGYNVLFPMGFDAFGLPTETYAIKTNTHPRLVTNQNITNFTEQLKKVGFSFDWTRVVDTTDPDYYKWTQWIFLKMFENGLAFKDKTYVNYCPNCKVVLSNEDSQGGKCDICHNDVIQKEKDVWYLRITEYADKLLEGLESVNYLPNIKLQQQNWIGKSKGAFVDFKVKENNETLKIYTTRPDTLFGVTFMVIAPEHPLIDKYQDKISNMTEINDYREMCKKKTEFERTQLNKEKTGVKIEGFTAINPVNNAEIPVFISDYVMMNYGTGAIMAVPAHDDRDYEFAQKFDIPIIQVLEEETVPPNENEDTKNSIVAIIYDPKKEKYLTINWGNLGGRLFVGGSIKEGETPLECAMREIGEETGYTDIQLVKETFKIKHHYYAHNKKKYFGIESTGFLFELKSDARKEQNLEEDETFTVEWVDTKTIEKEVVEPLHQKTYEYVTNTGAMIGDGLHINSSFLDGLNKEQAIEKIIDFLKEKGIGEGAVQYKMQDWAFNRQRYWGEPIPIIYCEKCGMVPVPYDELPLRLPDLENFEPGTDGESPLAKVESFVNCTCPKCGGKAARETDTMPQWAGSSWYFLRYTDPHNKEALASKEALDYWMNVDWYNGGMEHVTRHVIYSRFWHHFLYDLGIVSTKEPYQKRTAQGMILGSDGEKMSKSRGNVVNPNDIVETYGADTLRSYILFMGDYGLESPWNDNAIKGVNRFLDKVYSLREKVNDKNTYTPSLENMIHKTIKKVSEDYEAMKFNTAIAELMKLLNAYTSMDSITKKDYEILLTLLYPVAPHVTEEANELLGNTPIFEKSWPIYDESKLVDETFTLIVQVNGKVRGKLECASDMSEEEMKKQAKEIENVKTFIEGHEILKEIVVPKKLVNIVVK